jgi:hypothetical protein
MIRVTIMGGRCYGVKVEEQFDGMISEEEQENIIELTSSGTVVMLADGASDIAELLDINEDEIEMC